ncbi:CheY-like chemotaxis protein [Roseivirga ehrenbergii]|uniref:Response regulatory domain-containing protein n=1 Tax=Roseivirga ehrenbergii (strain DSM 102268 / JCM 13514 / KCTC 12282 / NCIMB 14502 / KMM 6017) TaxID=279360 RepID=A0A150X883_ROSEK|nr:response regulator [Roseivirga ehrenbergii]KYG74928.1 hypothetical protein MB14_06920 [Roseivirga ehrenbergii]TCL13731.1 CheY-like chemotaxis protein [Roseivirga ehrenbergii]
MKNENIFIVIDDDPVNNFLSKVIIRKVLPEAIVYEFTQPIEALEFIQSDNESHELITLFLDINMPIVDGWGFLERFKLLDAHLIEKIDIYMLSSSLDERDKIKAKSYKSVQDYIQKPLTMEGVELIASKGKAA